MHKNYWLPFLFSLVVLFSFNVLMVLSQAPDLLLKQLVSWVIGIGLFFIGTFITPKNIRPYRWIIFAASCLLILVPIILNNITRGSARWINIGPLSVQPSEVVKPWLLLFLVNTAHPYLHFLPVALIMMQPDLGSAISTSFLALPSVIYNKKFLKLAILASLAGLALSPILWRFALHDYQRDRIHTFLNPKSDPLDKGYNVIQAQIAVGSGGFWGKGFKNGTQGRLLFLPEKHTDFIFAALAEELGFVGILILLGGGYYLLISTLINKAHASHSPSLFLFTLAIAFQIWFQAFINIGMNIGLLPVTGIPLPFVSVGGSSVMALLFALGIIFSS